MNNRLSLHDELIEVSGLQNVYFQPPESIKLKYPCVTYHKAAKINRYADDIRYAGYDRYDITIISRDPDNDLADKLLSHFRYCAFARRYTADNLYHDALELYY